MKFISWLRAPLILPGAFLILKGMELFEYFTGKGDGQLKQQIVSEYDAEVVEIDKSFHPRINASPYFWPLSNYALLFIIYTVYTGFGDLTFTVIALLSLNSSVFILYLAATLHGRDSKMALDIEQYAQKNTGNACAIVGQSHEKGLIDRLANSSTVQILPQDS